MPTVNPIVVRNSTAVMQPWSTQFNYLAYTHLFLQYNFKKHSVKKLYIQEPIMARGVLGLLYMNYENSFLGQNKRKRLIKVL